MKPVLYIIRGAPGSGKSTLASKLVQRGFHFEADQFFLDPKGQYHFRRHLLREAHNWCQTRVREAMTLGKDIAVSNTFTKRWELRPYLAMAEKEGYDVQIIALRAPWTNTHGVPDEVVDRMREGFEP